MGYALGQLGLRRWRTADALRLAAAHRDPEMRTQGGIVDRASAVDWIGRVADLDNGHVYAVADADDHPIGCVAVTNIDVVLDARRRARPRRRPGRTPRPVRLGPP